MITRSASLEHRLVRETVRHAGSEAMLIYYDGVMPPNCDRSADGEHGNGVFVQEATLRKLAEGIEPERPGGAVTYWRLLDNGGLVVMQGDWT